MKSFELLDAMGYIHDNYIAEAQAYRNNPCDNKAAHSKMHRVLLVAAIVTMIAAMVGFAAIVLSLNGLIIGNFGQEQPMDYISLQGYSGSKNYLAAQEWHAFLEDYVPSVSDESFDEISSEYDAYLCRDQVMTDKVDEICDKYGLERLGPIHMEKNGIAVLDAVGVISIFTDSAAVEALLETGYWYRDGSFFMDGEICVDEGVWSYPVQIQYRCVMKTSFDAVYINIWDADEYTQWEYITKEGAKVLLALSENHAMVISNEDTFFAVMSILNPTMGGDVMRQETLEGIADTLTFRYKPQRLDERWDNLESEACKPGYELFEGVFLPIAEGRYGTSMDEVVTILTELGYDYRMGEGMLSVEDEKTGKWLSATLTNANITVELADLTYCHVEGERQFWVKADLRTEPYAFYIVNTEPPFEESPTIGVEEIKSYIYSTYYAE